MKRILFFLVLVFLSTSSALQAKGMFPDPLFSKV